MDKSNSFLFSDISPAWFSADAVTIREAACILGWVDPACVARNRLLPAQAEAMNRIVQRAVLSHALPYLAAFEWENNGYSQDSLVPIDAVSAHTHLADATLLRVRDLAGWCDAHNIKHPWQANANAKGMLPDHYPEELRAAIEAFNAVHGDPSAAAKRSPKAALTAWLAANKPELSTNARERIATVANWQPTGGAPKTPGE